MKEDHPLVAFILAGVFIGMTAAVFVGVLMKDEDKAVQAAWPIIGFGALAGFVVGVLVLSPA